MRSIVLVLLCSLRGSTPSTFDFSNMGTSVFPFSVQIGVTNFTLDHNLIEAVTYINPYPNLAIFSMYDNLVVDFPNFSNITGSLTDVNMGKNRISYVPAGLLDILNNLIILDLSDNRLTSIPDVLGPQNTLEHLDLSQNNMTDFPSLDKLSKSLKHLNVSGNELLSVNRFQIEAIPTLQELDVSLNKMETFPNLCTKSGNATLDVSVRENPFNCNRNMGYLKLAEKAGVIRLITSGTDGAQAAASCSTPPRLLSETWNDVTVFDFHDDDEGMSCPYLTFNII